MRGGPSGGGEGTHKKGPRRRIQVGGGEKCYQIKDYGGLQLKELLKRENKRKDEKGKVTLSLNTGGKKRKKRGTIDVGIGRCGGGPFRKKEVASGYPRSQRC